MNKDDDELQKIIELLDQDFQDFGSYVDDMVYKEEGLLAQIYKDAVILKLAGIKEEE